MITPGDEVKDKISGFRGIALARTEWLYGCVRVSVQPQALHEGKPVDDKVFDEAQLEVIVSQKFKGALMEHAEKAIDALAKVEKRRAQGGDQVVSEMRHKDISR